MKDLKWYLGFIKPYRLRIVAALSIGVIKFSIPLLLPLLIQYTVDHLLLEESISAEKKISQLFWLLGGAAVVFVVLRGPVEFARQYLAQWITSSVLFDIRNRMYDHLQRLSLRFYHNRKTGDTISRFINDVEQTKNIVEVGMMNVWLDLFSLLLALGFMIYMDFKLTIAAFVVLPLYAISVKILYKRLKQLTKDRSKALAGIQAYLTERIQGIAVIRSFTLERYEREQFGQVNQQFLQKALSQTRWNAMTFAIINTLTDIAPLLVIGYGGYAVIQGEVTLGTFVAFFGYLERMYNPLRRLVNASTVLTQASASLERVMELMEEPYDIRDAPQAKELKEPIQDIELRQVSFKYETSSSWILQNIQLHIRSGETIALVGMSGGGKSSLITLLPRFYDVQEGAVLVNGLDVREWTLSSLRSQMGMVLQDHFLFSGSVHDNIRVGNPDADEEAVRAAARAANADIFIEQLPQGYDTEIGERGVKLSGGQKQRIAIARVFLKNPAVLILDEATSALDLEAEHQIQESLLRLSEGRTTIIVAHRLSTITHADRIIVIQEGRITEEGTNEELLQREGDYARLYNIQQLPEHTH
ncbi:ABC transporter ATP-binding protein [Paenibacillus massiliensis]|uniref:ABC transporter ATP-binding protein n=1 Tax=Paenibacillus massiliensis TaxID=225917 RepID=UPI000472D41C|nr:ABC transporter ATP-binding protein [Paenibacillus massiliensis]